MWNSRAGANRCDAAGDGAGASGASGTSDASSVAAKASVHTPSAGAAPGYQAKRCWPSPATRAGTAIGAASPPGGAAVATSVVASLHSPSVR